MGWGKRRLEPYISNIKGSTPDIFWLLDEIETKSPTVTHHFDDDHSNETTGETARCNQLKIQDGGLETSNSLYTW